MGKLYSIGETAKILGISVQTLRNYSNLELFQPEYIDPDTGYRYYSFRQFHYIDRIKYLRNLGVPLREIREIFKRGDIGKLAFYLEKQKQAIEAEIQRLNDTKEDLQWYMDYFNYLNTHHLDHIPYIRHLDKRYVLNIPCEESDTVEAVETRLTNLRSELTEDKVHILRQYGFIGDFEDLLENKFTKKEYFIYLKDTSNLEPSNYRILPAGEYLCFRAKICTDDWDISTIKKYFEYDIAHPKYFIANEHEDNLIEFHDCPYEVQILIKPDKNS